MRRIGSICHAVLWFKCATQLRMFSISQPAVNKDLRDDSRKGA
jgi:hypothetical protein